MISLCGRLTDIDQLTAVVAIGVVHVIILRRVLLVEVRAVVVVVRIVLKQGIYLLVYIGIFHLIT